MSSSSTHGSQRANSLNRFGSIEEVQKFFGKEERLSHFMGENIKSQDKSVCSIRVETLRENKVRPCLNKWKKRRWASLNTGTNEKPCYILINIDSIIKNTGLTKERIKNAIKEGHLEDLLSSTLQNTVATVATGISQLDFETTHNVSCDKQGHFKMEEVLKKFNLTEQQFRDAHASHSFYRGSVHHTHDNRFYISITLKLPPPIGKELEKMVRDVLKFREEVMTAGAQLKAKRGDSSTENYGLLSKEWKWTKVSSLHAYISVSGKVYLSSLSKEIGDGGFSKVWLGIEVAATPKKVVLNMPKEIKDLYEQDKQGLEMLKLAQGDQIVKYHGCFKINIGLFGKITRESRIGMILEYCAKGVLKENIQEIQQLPLNEKIQTQILIMKKLAAGLAYMHKKNIYHRDIKPDNILLTQDENGVNAVYIDFGLATSKKTSNIAGTPGYFSPDKWATGKHKSADDVWALGMTFYEMISPKNYPRFNDPESLWDLYNKDQYEFNQKVTQELARTQNTILGVRRPSFEHTPAKNLEKTEQQEQQYRKVQYEMELLCWKMLHDYQTMTAEHVFEQIKKIEKKFNRILSKGKQPVST